MAERKPTKSLIGATWEPLYVPLARFAVAGDDESMKRISARADRRFDEAFYTPYALAGYLNLS